MNTLLRNITIMALAATPFVSGCSDEGNEINYNIQTGNKLYLPAEGKSVDLSQGSDVRFEWSPSIAEDNGFVSYELLFDRENGDFSQPLAAMTSQLTGSQTYLSVSAKDLNTVPGPQASEPGKPGTSAGPSALRKESTEASTPNRACSASRP